MILEMLQYEYMQYAIAAGACAGVCCALVGVFVVTMHLSFLGICIAHAAFAGALLGVWLQFEPLIGALAFSLGAAALVGPLADRGELSPDASIGIIFSLMLGLAFVFLGLTPGSHTAALSLFWGSILTVSPRELILLAIMAGVMLLLLILFFKEIQAVLCHREVALAVGIPATLIFYGMLFATGSAIALSLRSIGGLLIYSLVLNPAAAAYQLTYNLKIMMALAMLFGVFSSWIGLFASYYWDLPTGATIVLTTAAIFAVASLISPKRKVHPWKATPTGQ